jgi:hypothetical protein
MPAPYTGGCACRAPAWDTLPEGLARHAEMPG